LSAKADFPPQSIQLSSELQQQVSVLSARINNANLVYSDLLKEMNNTFNAMAKIIATLQKENAELKAKPKETPKTK
jgi:hypothetical protein